VFAYNKVTPFPGVYALVPTIGAVLIILFATQQTTIGKFLGNKIFVGIGLISYSAYLWHQPLFAFARHKNLSFDQNPYVVMLFLLLSLGLAYLSWKYIETPFRNRNIIGRKNVFILASGISTVLILVGLSGFLNNGFESLMLRYKYSAKERNEVRL